MAQGEAFSGFQNFQSGTSLLNAIEFVVQQVLSGNATTKLVRVEKVTAGAGALAVAGTVDVLPLVNQIDGAGQPTPHAIVYALPYLRVQGGLNAAIIDPEVGDIGFAVFTDRDSSSVIANKGPANPGSRRRFDMADGLYVGGILNAVPTQYVRFSADGMELVSPTKITLTAPEVEITASTSLTVTSPTMELDGDTHTTGDVTGDGDATYVGSVTGAGIVLDTHHHTGVTTGGGNTGGPV